MFQKLLVACVALMFVSAPALGADAKAPADQRIRDATVVSFAAGKLEVTTTEGKSATVAVNSSTVIEHQRPGTTADIKAGTFVGCTAVEGPDHKLRATEVHVFPEVMRGTGEGHYPWPMDTPKADTTMTNGNVDTMTGVSDGSTIKVSYKQKDGTAGTIDIVVPPNVPVTVIEVIGTDALKAGTKVSILAQVGADSSLTAKRIHVAN